MKKRLIFGIPFTAIGLLIALGPYTLFPVCEVMGDMFMKCFWTRRAELGIGIIIAVLGVLSILFKPARLGIAVFLNGVLALLIPAILIGVCDHAHASCRVLALPSLLILSAILIAIAVINGIALFKSSGESSLLGVGERGK
jgi:hypothetical protein